MDDTMIMILADTSTPGLPLLGALLFGSAVGSLVYMLLATASDENRGGDSVWQIESARRTRVTQGTRTYRWFGPWIDELRDLRLLHVVGRIGRVRQDLRAGGESLPYTPEEFLAFKAFQGLLVGVAVAYMFDSIAGPVAGLLFGSIAMLLYYVMSTQKLHRRATRRKIRIKQRLPFAIDLMALMMEAGGGFRESLTTIVRECQDHPLGVEFGQVLSEIEYGQTLRQALSNLRDRLADIELNEMVFAVHKAEELGTPLSQIFLGQAEQMRLRRSQRAEKLAGKANANISFPALVVMMGCVLLIMAPFILNAFTESTSNF